MANEQQGMNDTDQQQADQQANQSESGMPGGGVGRKEGPFNTPVYPVSADAGAPGDTEIESENAWGQGQRGAAGYKDSGGSSLDDTGIRERQEEQQQQQQQQQRANQQGGQSSDQQAAQQPNQQ